MTSKIKTPDTEGLSASAMVARAETHARAGRWQEALRTGEAALELEPDQHAFRVQLARWLAKTGDTSAAVEQLRKVLAAAPSAALHVEVGVLLIDAGDGAGAAAEFRKAIELDPTESIVFSNLGSALRLTGKKEEARAAFERALALDPADATAHGNLGNLLRDLGEADAAVTALEACIRLQPGSSEAHAFLGGALLEAGRPGEALQALEQALQLDPINRTAFAYKSAALQETGDTEAASFLLDLESLIDVHTFAAVNGYPSLAAFNNALADCVQMHPSLSSERTGIATRFGSQTENLLLGAEGAMSTFETLINLRVSEYFRRREICHDHPFMRHRMQAWSSVAWGVVLRSGGHQSPHIHPSAWLSGVYYVKVPSSVRADSESKEGWIEFGSPPRSLNCRQQTLKKFLFPEEGKMILFPSYFYHRTVPLEVDEERISIAFDVSPGRAAA